MRQKLSEIFEQRKLKLTFQTRASDFFVKLVACFVDCTFTAHSNFNFRIVLHSYYFAIFQTGIAVNGADDPGKKL